jgi:hypothetical protein
MAVFLFLVASIGGVVVADLVLENPTVGEATVFNQPVSGYRQGELLAMAAALGFVVAVLLVASVSSTQRRRARRKQLRAIRASTQRQAAAPERDQASLLDEWFGRHVPVSEPGEPAPQPTRGASAPAAGPMTAPSRSRPGRPPITPDPSTSGPGGPPTSTEPTTTAPTITGPAIP